MPRPKAPCRRPDRIAELSEHEAEGGEVEEGEPLSVQAVV